MSERSGVQYRGTCPLKRPLRDVLMRGPCTSWSASGVAVIKERPTSFVRGTCPKMYSASHVVVESSKRRSHLQREVGCVASGRTGAVS